MNIKEMQKLAYDNKVKKGFNIDNIEMEFCYLYGEIAEAYEAYLRKKEDLGEELADVTIYLMGLSEILGIDLQKEIELKIEKNKNRVYKVENKVATRISEK
ncbi:MAG: hypothetical protein HFE04_00500 [Bacilli bacterium]|nr:hypothetical protein [Bacilli bacterium]